MIYLGKNPITNIREDTKKNSALNKIVTSPELKNLDTPEKIIDFLQREDDKGKRNIDILISSSHSFDIQDFLNQVRSQLGNALWYTLLTMQNKQNENAVGFWVKKGCPSYGNKLFLDVFKKDNLVKMMTHIEKEPGKKTYTSFMMCKDYSYVIKFLEVNKKEGKINDEQIRDAIISPVGGENFATKCMKYHAIDKLQNLFSDEKVKKEFDDYLNKHYRRKQVAHFLGITDVGTKFDHETNERIIIDDKYKAKMHYQSWEGSTALPLFKERLNEFKPDNFVKEFDQIKEAFNITEKDGDASSMQIEKYKSAYSKGKAIIIPSGWPRHSITIGAINGYLVVANKGEGKHRKGGCIIYKLDKPLTPALIEMFAKKESEKIIQTYLKSLDKKIFQALPLKSQKYGTCSIANKKAVVAGMLPLLHHLGAGKSGAMSQTMLNSARDQYKKFTSSMNELTLKEMLDEFNKPITVNIKEVIEALCDFCNQHTDLDKKSEMKLLQEIDAKIRDTPYQKEFLDGLSETSRLMMRDLPEAIRQYPLNQSKMLIADYIKFHKDCSPDLGQALDELSSAKEENLYDSLRNIYFQLSRIYPHDESSEKAQEYIEKYINTLMINKAKEIAAQLKELPSDISKKVIDLKSSTPFKDAIKVVNDFARQLDKHRIANQGKSLFVSIAMDEWLNKVLNEAIFLSKYPDKDPGSRFYDEMLNSGKLYEKDTSEEYSDPEMLVQINLITSVFSEIIKDDKKNPVTKARIAFTIFDTVQKNMEKGNNLKDPLIRQCRKYKEKIQQLPYLTNIPLEKEEIKKLLPNLSDEISLSFESAKAKVKI